MLNEHIDANIPRTISPATGVGISQDITVCRPLPSSSQSANPKVAPPSLYILSSILHNTVSAVIAVLDASRPGVLRFARRVASRAIFGVLLLILTSLFTIEAVAQVRPVIHTATPGYRQVKLSWHPPAPPPSSYDYRYITSRPDGTFDFTGSPINWRPTGNNNTTYTVTGLTNGVKYAFFVKGAGGFSSVFSAATLPIPAPGLTATPGDGQIRLNWKVPASSSITGYQWRRDSQTSWTDIAGTTYTATNLINGTSYTYWVRAVNGTIANGTPSSVTVTPLRAAPGAPGTLNVEKVEDTALLTWNPPSNAEEILRYEYSSDGGSTWNPTGSSDTTYTVTGLEAGETYTFFVRAIYVDGRPSRIISHRSRSSNAAVLSIPKPKRVQDCPVGWVRSDGFAGRNRRVLLYEVKLDMDLQNRVSIYKPDWVAIYVHPDEALENLDGWKLQVALPYNRHSEYLLRAENSVVMDAGFVEGGFAFIENPKEASFPMTGMGFPGSPAPGFDYRLYDDSGRRVDFGISCYKRFDIFQVLKNTEDPRVLRKVLLESFDWNSHYLRSEWTVATPVPAAPSLIKGNMVGTWGDLKKQ
ncbi:MAG: fibronectin type III domain-containing protein [Candidatus Poribacteria bacterium]|nr:fibronectin type III domain-containing protein [Candidatus Poribacteria bacterium]